MTFIEDHRLELTKEQKAAMTSLERAFKKCDKAGVLLHNCYGTLIAYNSEFVESVNDDKDEYDCREGETLYIPYNLTGWADDEHYIHFKGC